ncbi:GSCOCG00000512001-RA-CDS [Cotesia congregata]|nr:GSCOCG00000512001-RA-CDS [Cotesia congregata]
MDLSEVISSKFGEKNLKNILSKATGHEISKISDTGCEFEANSTKGDNYLSVVHRVRIHGLVDGKQIETRVIIKTLPRNIATRKTFRSAEFFENEINFYNKVIPLMEKFLETKGKKNFLPAPKCWDKYFDGENDFIVLEDIRTRGYGHIARQDPWKLENIKVILKTLAQFHAISFAFKDQCPEVFSQIPKILKECFYGTEKHWAWYGEYYNETLNVAKDAVSKEYPGSSEEKKFLSIPARFFFEKSMEICRHPEAPTSVVTQGDSWAANFMLNLSEKSSSSDQEPAAILLDFQLARCSSPVTDIAYFLYTSTDKVTRDNHFQDLLNYYHCNLIETVVSLGSKPDLYPLDTFLQEEKFILGFGFSIEALPVMTLDESEAFDIEDIQGTEAVNISKVWKVKPISCKKNRKRVADAMVHAIHQGFIYKLLTEKTLENIVKQATGGNNIEIIDWKSEEASKKGDSYLSTVTRLTIEAIVDNKNNNLKVVMPLFRSFLTSKNQNHLLLVPDCYAHILDGENDFIVLEDVTTRGFGPASRQSTLSIEEFELILKAMARFHGVSFACKANDSKKFSDVSNQLIETYFSDNHWDWYKTFHGVAIKIAKDAMEKEYPETEEQKKFLSIQGNDLWRKSVQVCSQTTTPSSVINQGDAWAPNFLMRSTESGEKEALLLDFQLARCASPIADLSFFIYSCSDTRLREIHFDKLLEFYYKHLAETIKVLGGNPDNIYSRETFFGEVQKEFGHGLNFCLESVPLSMLEEDELFELDEIQGTTVDLADVWKLKPIENKEKRKRLADIIMHAIQHDFI